MVVKICPKCKKEYRLGVNGAFNPKRNRDECDTCAKTRRDNNGHAWLRGERAHAYQNDDGTIYKVSRRQAFRK